MTWMLAFRVFKVLLAPSEASLHSGNMPCTCDQKIEFLLLHSNTLKDFAINWVTSIWNYWNGTKL